jgi:hypothetical protein
VVRPRESGLLMQSLAISPFTQHALPGSSGMKTTVSINRWSGNFGLHQPSKARRRSLLLGGNRAAEVDRTARYARGRLFCGRRDRLHPRRLRAMRARPDEAPQYPRSGTRIAHV